MTPAELHALAEARQKYNCDKHGASLLARTLLVDALIESLPEDVRERMAEKLREGMRSWTAAHAEREPLKDSTGCDV